MRTWNSREMLVERSKVTQMASAGRRKTISWDPAPTPNSTQMPLGFYGGRLALRSSRTAPGVAHSFSCVYGALSTWQPLSWGRRHSPKHDKYLRLHGADILAEETADKAKKSVRRLRATVLIEITQGVQVGRDDGPAFSPGHSNVKARG